MRPTGAGDFNDLLRPRAAREAADARHEQTARAAEQMFGFKMPGCADDAASSADDPRADGAGFTITDPPGETDDEAIARLAKLPLLEYERARAAEADKLGCRASMLDKLVQAARGGNDPASGRTVALHDPEPWPDPVVLPDLLDALAKAVRRHVVMADEAADAIALWIAHTYAYDRFDHTPRLAITSPTKRCGKSTLLDVLRITCRRTLKADNVERVRHLPHDRGAGAAHAADRRSQLVSARGRGIARRAQFRFRAIRPGDPGGRAESRARAGYVRRPSRRWPSRRSRNCRRPLPIARSRSGWRARQRLRRQPACARLARGAHLAELARKLVRWARDGQAGSEAIRRSRTRSAIGKATLRCPYWRSPMRPARNGLTGAGGRCWRLSGCATRRASARPAPCCWQT